MESIYTLLRSPLLTLSGPIFIAIFVGIFWLRSGSFYSLLDRIWRLIAGKVEVADKKLSEFIHDTHDLEKFRFMFGIKVETKNDLHKLLEWLKENSVSIGSAQKARRWIDIKSLNIIELPSKKYQAYRALTALICVLLGMLILEISTFQSALLQMKKSEVWFLADTEKITGLTNDWVIKKNECKGKKSEITNVSGFSLEESKMLCEALNGNELKTIVAETVKTQRALCGVLGLTFFLGMMVSIFQLKSAEEAVKIDLLLRSQTKTVAD